MNKYYITESLGEVRKRTPEGYLLCVGVPIARTGEYEYGAHEMPDFEGNADGIVICERPADVVFADTTIASFEGKPFVVGHPDEDVDITNWSDYAAGVVQNVRKGEGSESDLLIADILVTNLDAVKAIDNGVREVSCGYDGDYEQIEPGRVRLKDIIGNHVALVPRGRAGHRVVIGDAAQKNGKEVKLEVDAKDKKKVKFMDWLKDAFVKAKDEGLVLEIGAPEPPAEPAPKMDEGTFDIKGAFDALGMKLDELVSVLKEGQKGSAAEPAGESGGNPADEKTPEPGASGETDPAPGQQKTGDAKPAQDDKASSKTTDSVPTLDAKTVVGFKRAAEILAPGFDTKSLTLDSALSITDAMRKVLTHAYQNDASVRRDVEEMHGEVIRSWAAVEDAEVKVLFTHASKTKGARNNQGAKVSTKDFAVVGGMEVSDLQKNFRDFWNKKEGK